MFGVPVTSIQWVVIAYILTFACGLLPAGRLADRAGHGRVFATGLAVSGTAYLLCGAAPAFGWLLAARVLQGVGAALIFGSAPALVTLVTPEALRGRALGGFNLVASAGMVLGPLAGGALVGLWGWRVVYLGRLPLVAAGLLLTWRRLPGRLRAGAGDGTFAGPVFWRAVGRVADRRTFVVANTLHLLANVALFSIWLLVPYYLIERRGLSAGPGGVLFAAGPLAWALGTPVGGWVADRGGSRWLAPLALATEALGLALVSRLDAASATGEIAIALALAGAGMGLFIVPNMHYVMGALPRGRQGVAGSLVMLMRTVGVVLGASLTTFVYDARLAAHAAPLAGADAVAGAFADTFGVMAVLAAGIALLSLVPPRGHPEGRIRIRRLDPEDRAPALVVINEAARWYREFLPADEVHEPEMTEAGFDAESRRLTWYGAEGPDGALLGVMGLEYAGDVALLRHAYVRPDAQRRGIGAALRAHLEGEVRGVDRIVVGTYAGNYKARRALEQAGYTLSEDSQAVLRRYYRIPEDRLRGSVTYEKCPGTAPAAGA